MELVTEENIRDTVMEVLKGADMEEMTEFKVRVAAAERLGIDLSDTNHKRFIRGVVESFLLSTTESTGNGKAVDWNVEENTQDHRAKMKKHPNDDDSLVICQVLQKIIFQTRGPLQFRNLEGELLYQLENFIKKDGKQAPSAKGISMTSEQWRAFSKSVPAVEEAIVKMQSKLRSEPSGEQNEEVATSVFSPLENFPTEVDRFNGKNYQWWAQQMELFLNQLNIAYVLTDPCPSVNLCPQSSSKDVARVKAAERKWVNDDRSCRRHILNSLSDHLYHRYSKKTKSAKELLEELKLVYLDEEFETMRSQVKKYMEFQMVDEKSIFAQVLELNKIADSVVAAGTLIHENFHVSVILLKLPPSWKDFCIKLMHMEYLTFTMLMDSIKAEEEFCNQDMKGELSKFVEFSPAVNLTQEMREMSKKKKEAEKDGNSIVCYNCGMKGHVAKRCQNKKLRKEMKERQNGESSSITVDTDVTKASS